MAVTITRKLFPVSTGTNQQTPNCSTCSYDCPFNCYGFPDFYYLQPPPPPPHHQTKLQPLTIALIALLMGFFFTFSFYILVVKCRARCCGSRRGGAEPSQSDGGGREFLNENQIDHPIWFITTVGLQQSVINSITVCKYKTGEGLIEGTVCSVCLSEFQEDEMLRLLPKCSHAFHIGCVDTWLRTHTNCPLCRAQIMTNLGPVNQNEATLSVIEETQMENSERNGEVLGENQSFENRGDAGDEQREIVVENGEIVSKEGIFESDDSNANFEVEGNEIIRINLMDSSACGSV